MKKLIKHKDKYYIQSDGGYNEVLATTDSSLMHLSNNGRVGYPLPQPSPQFIQAYIEAYNAGNPIVDIMVEYEEDEPVDGYKYETTKVDRNNYITITKCKESWSREEVESIVEKLCMEMFKSNIEGKVWQYPGGIDKWIADNL